MSANCQRTLRMCFRTGLPSCLLLTKMALGFTCSTYTDASRTLTAAHHYHKCTVPTVHITPAADIDSFGPITKQQSRAAQQLKHFTMTVAIPQTLLQQSLLALLTTVQKQWRAQPSKCKGLPLQPVGVTARAGGRVQQGQLLVWKA